MLTKNWDGIKTIVTLKVIVKASPNLLMLNGLYITNKTSIVTTFITFLSMLALILPLAVLNQKHHLIFI